jgi:hypothetical protein
MIDKTHNWLMLKLIETLFDKKHILMPVYFRINYPTR